MQEIDHVIFLSHPYAWKAQYPDGGGNIVWGDFTYSQLVAMEGTVADRWLEAIRHADSHTAIVINGMDSHHIAPDGPVAPLLKAVQQYMPGRNLVTVQGATESFGPYIIQQFRAMGYTIRAQATWEAWGQSTEGCAPNWAGHIAAGLGIIQGIPMNYEMTFPDAPFAMTGRFLQRIAIAGTDVNCYLSRAQNGSHFAIYFPGVVHDKQPERFVTLTAESGSLSFTNKAGTARLVSYVGDRYHVPLAVDPAEPLYIWANSGTSFGDFQKSLAAANCIGSAKGDSKMAKLEQNDLTRTHPTHTINVGTRLEMFVDDALIEAIGGHASLRLYPPAMKEIALTMDRPWEGNMCGAFKTYFRDGSVFRMYYQAWNGVISEAEGKTRLQDAPIRIGYAESEDGICWRRPSLGLIEFNGSKDNNIVWEGQSEDQKGIHGFAPFKDLNPACPPEARYKAVGAKTYLQDRALYAVVSADGIRWRLMSEDPILKGCSFDSQNLVFWDAVRNEYRAYVRDVLPGDFRGIKTATSDDFVRWTEPQWLEYPGSPSEQLYTNMVIPYYRAPHLFLGFPARYVERSWSSSIEALPELEHRRLRAKANERYGAALSDGLFMASRDGRTFKKWDEAFIRPGLRPVGSWAYGDCYQGWGLLETPSDVTGAPNELSTFATEGYWRGAANAIRRYTLRVDGFVSLHAPLGGGELTTKPFTFAGDRLVLNISTSAAGGARVEMQSPDGRPLEGFGLDDCTEIIGDDLAFAVRWRGDVGAVAGQPVRLRFVLRDADLYSYRFD